MSRRLPPTLTAAKSPDWLPAGWIMECRVLRTGREIRSYTNLQTDQKFSTKDDVLEYIEMEKVREKRLQANKHLERILKKNKHLEMCTANESTKLVEPEPDEHLEWLPDNWIVEVRAQKNGLARGKHEKVYTDPSTGYEFHSKRQVLLFLGYSDCETSMEELEKSSTSTDSSSKPLSPGKKQKLEHQATSRQLFSEGSPQGRNEGNSSEVVSPIAKVPTEEHLVNVAVGIAFQKKESLGLSNSSELLNAEGNQGYQLVSVLSEKKSFESEIQKIRARNTEQTSDQSMNEPVMDHACDASDNVFTLSNKSEEPLEDQALHEEQQRQMQTGETISDKSEHSIFLSFGDSSLDPSFKHVYKRLTGTVPVEDLTNNDGLVLTPASENILEQNKSHGNKRQKSITKRNQEQKSRRKLKKKDPELPCKSSEQLAEPEMIPSTLLGERIGRMPDTKSSTEKTDPNIRSLISNGFAHHNPLDINTPVLEGPSEKTEMPMECRGDYLSDMCLGFSLKTIIGETTMEDDSVISNYLKQQVDGTLPLPDFGLPSFSDIEISPDEPDEQAAVRKRCPVNSSLPSCSAILSEQICLRGCCDSIYQSIHKEEEEEDTRAR